MKCPRCQQENSPHHKFCPECGTPLSGAVALMRSYGEPQAEIEGLRRALGEALEQQTATAEILKVISTSPTDLQPVLGTIVKSAARFCGAEDATIAQLEGAHLRAAAHHGPIPIPFGLLVRVVPGSVGGRCVLERRAIHTHDILADAKEFPETAARAREFGYRTTLCVPLLREGAAIGTIHVRRTELDPFSDKQIELLKTFADQAVIAIENVRLFTELQQKNEALTQAHGQVTEALERQTATSEILRVIARFPTDLQPVLNELVENAGRLCQSAETALLLVEGEQLRVVATFGYAAGEASDLSYPIHRGWVAGRAVVDATAVHVEDLANAEAEFPLGREIAIRFGHRTALATPLLRDGAPIGVLFLRRRQVRPFSNNEIALLQTFADQAVIAIENVRLFNETKEALEQQTATSEILRVISTSPTDVQPVFDAIVRNAANVCGAFDAVLALAEGDDFVTPAHHGPIPRPTGNISMQGTVTGQAIREARTVHVADLLAADHYPIGRKLASEIGYRTVLCVPLLHDGASVGAIGIRRTEVRPFTDKQIALLKTFADQAVIAIENVRLFKELQSSNRELMTALDQQTATSEVLRTIAHTKTDPQPVFDTILRSAVRLCHAAMAAVSLTDGRMLYLPANYGSSPEAMAAVRARFPRPLDMETATGTAILTRSVIHEPDVQEPSVAEFTRQSGRVLGFRSLLSVPMLRQGEAVGAINVTRREPGPFSEAEVALLKTFADQAVIAVENVRLFTELEGANRELSAASQHKSEFLANMSHELRTPLNAIIGFSEVLGERLFGELNDKQEEYLKDIHASGQHLLSLINDILDLSKIEAGRMELELTDFDLPTAIDNALTLVRERAGRRGIALHQAADEGVGQTRGDERKIKQVLLNLLSNAIKFTPDRGRIAVRARPVDGSIEVSVSDTGVGIAPEDQEAIFEEFRQVGTAAKKVEGTGLGLALSRKFVELHGGRIEVQSQLGVGSTFTFTIPRIGT
jgi:signal transduction histidine kinase